jgi:hypothetical protein
MALSYVGDGTGAHGPYGSGINSFSFGASVTANTDVLVFLTAGNANPGTVTVSDNLNGTWNQGFNVYNAANGNSLFGFYVQATTTGDPNISLNCASAANGIAYVHQFTGFQYTATWDAAAGGHSLSNTSVSNWTNPAATNFNNEFLIAVLAASAGGSGSPPTGWTQIVFGSEFEVISATPASFAVNSPMGGSGTFDAFVMGLHDAPANSPIIMGQACLISKYPTRRERDFQSERRARESKFLTEFRKAA